MLSIAIPYLYKHKIHILQFQSIPNIHTVDVRERERERERERVIQYEYSDIVDMKV